MIEAEWWEYEGIDELAAEVAGDVAFIIGSAVEARDASLVAVPGGSTGPKVYRALAKQKLPWP
jgi:6-phosphogluconolactonase